MAFMQDILAQLSSMQQSGSGGNLLGEDATWMDIANIDPSEISFAMQNFSGLGSQDLPSSLFQTISPGMLLGGLGKTYSPAIESHGASLLSNLKSSFTGQKGKQAYVRPKRQEE